MALNIVSMSLVAVGITLLAEMSDHTLREYTCPYGVPDNINALRWLTDAEIRERLLQHARARRDDVAYRLHADKTRRLGYDYASRGY